MVNQHTANTDIPRPALRRFSSAPVTRLLSAVASSLPALPLQTIAVVDRQPAATRFCNFCTDLLERLGIAINPATAILTDLWARYYQGMAVGEENARSKLEFIVGSLFAMVQLKSPGISGFPYQTHSVTIIFTATGILAYFLAFVAEFVINAAGLDRLSTYAVTAHLVKMGSLCILAASLASLLCF